MIYADGRLAAAEKKLFDTYKLEMEYADLSKAHAVDFAQGLAAFDDSSVEEKTGIFFELYAIALIDEAYPEEERVLVDIMQKRFGITDAKMQEMRNGLNALTAMPTLPKSSSKRSATARGSRATGFYA